jgi:metal-responsive CopG/Arc/MetJ family transcriptional regulator
MSKKPIQRGRGRPTQGASALMAPVMIRFPQEMLAEIEAMLAERLDKPDRSGFIRELIAEAIAARRAKTRK